ncbi:hypothetical protein SFRURICE_011239 [Spodoptera frugiperda]|nr:hypothetical protein SFRURICE_011239 [Spodoptera frugiperda]
MQKFPSEVETVPRNKSDHITSLSKSTPLNVKIRVRKKDDDKAEENDSTTTKHVKGLQTVRLVSSDQTIMNFDVFMEAEFERKPPPQKIRKQIFDMLQPGVCLGALEDDDYTCIPSASYSANISGPSQTTKSDGTLKHTFTLSKNVYQDYTVSTQSKEQKYFFGKCKPGGCLDPPYSEDKYSYKPSTKPDPEKLLIEKVVLNKEEISDKEVVESDTDKQPIKREDSKSGRRSSIFDGNFFKKKRKSSEQSTNTQPPEHKDSVVNIFQGDPSVNSTSGHSNPIITYPPKISSDSKVKSQSPSEDKPRKSFNEHSESYFVPPKGITRDIKENDNTNQNEPKRRSSDKNTPKEFKFPTLIPVPIPIPLPSTKPDSESTAPTGHDLAIIDNKTTEELNSEPSKDLVPNMKSVGTQTSFQLRDSPTGDNTVHPTNVDKSSNKNSDTELKSPYTDDLQKKESNELSNENVPQFRVSEDLILEKPESAENIMSNESTTKKTEPEKDINPQSSSDNQEEFKKDKRPLENIEKKVIPIPIYIKNNNEAEVKTNGINEDLKSQNSEQNMPDNGSSDTQSPHTVTPYDKTREPIPEGIKQINSDKKYFDESRDLETGLDANIEETGVLKSDDETAKDLKIVRPTKPIFGSEKDKDEKNLSSKDGKDYVPVPIIIKEKPTPPGKDSNNDKDLIGDDWEDSKDNTIDPFPSNIPPKIPKIPEVDPDNIKHSGEYDEMDETKPILSVKNKEKIDSPDECVYPLTKENNNVKIITKQPKPVTETTDSNDDFRNIITKRTDATSIPKSSDESAETIKSVLRKDPIFVNLGFYSHLNDKNERVIETFDTKHVPNRSPNDLVTIVKSQIRISSNEIKIPVDAEHDMSIRIKKPDTNQRVAIDESRLVPDNAKVIKQKSTDPSGGETITSKTNKSEEATQNRELEISILEFYEQELIPLQLVIRNLRDEIDVLAAQQLVFKDKIFSANKTKTRAVHSNKKCYGCLKK